MYIEQLRKELGEEKVLIEDFERYVYGADWSPRTKDEVIPPDVVVCPKTTEDVVKVIKVAYEHEIPVTAGGGLTGMAGGAVPIHGGIYIDSTSMNKIIEIDIPNQTVRAQGGVTLQEINDAVEDKGFWYPHLPESKWSCTIASSIACDNDSTFGIRFGKILSSLLSVEMVTGTGEVLELGHGKVHFTSSGYKLKDLLAGSEGTLGVITAATVKIEPLPETRVVEMILFPKIGNAVDFLTGLLKAGVNIEAAHINGKYRIRFYTHAYKEKFGREPEIPQWAGALLGVSFAGDKDVCDFQRDYSLKMASEFKGEPIKEKEITKSWWASKHTLEFEPFKQKWPESQRIKKFGAADPGVPPSRLEEYYRKYVETAKKYGLEILGMNAYLEQPNRIGFSLSCAVFVDYRNQDEVNRFRKYFEEMAKAAVDMGGTMSTYMGDTNLKAPYLEYEHGKNVEYYKRIKEMFDPKGILNPGKIFIDGIDEETDTEAGEK